MIWLISLQLSELEQRVIEAEGRAEEAEDKVKIHCSYIYYNKNHSSLSSLVTPETL